MYVKWVTCESESLKNCFYGHIYNDYLGERLDIVGNASLNLSDKISMIIIHVINILVAFGLLNFQLDIVVLNLM